MYKPLFEELIEKKKKFAFSVEQCTKEQLEQLEQIFRYKYNLTNVNNVDKHHKRYVIDEYVKGFDRDSPYDHELKYIKFNVEKSPKINWCLVNEKADGYLVRAENMYYATQECSIEALEHCGYEIIDIDDVLYEEKEIIIKREKWSTTWLILKENNKITKEIILKCLSQQYEYDQEALKCYSILKNFKTKFETGEKVKVLCSSATEKQLKNCGYNKEDDIQGVVRKITLDYENKKAAYDVFLRLNAYNREVTIKCTSDDLKQI